MVLLIKSRGFWMFSLHRQQSCVLPLFLYSLQFCCTVITWPYVSRVQEDKCPGPRWNVMCRSCCEYELIRCKCPSQRTQVGYAVPCCRNDILQCDPCIIHQGCNVFDNCKRCNNGTWQAKDDFYISGRYCTECRQGWSGGDCLTCGQVIQRRQGHVTLESYPINAECDWTLQVSRGSAMEFRFTMLHLEFDHRCRYDFVELRDGDSIHSPLIGRYCGDKIPPPIRSSGDSLHIHFVSDGYNNYDGFSATFQELSVCSPNPCMNGGVCSLNTIKTFHCACQAGFTGLHCENESGCVIPQKPAHGDHFLLYDNGGIAMGVQYRCYKPYKLRGVSRRMCLSNGTWSGTAPTCTRDTDVIRKQCPPLSQLHHGYTLKAIGLDGAVKSVEFSCNNSYVLSGNSKRTCQLDGTWNGRQPQCIKACREPKVSKLVRQKVLKSQLPLRKSPLHRLYASLQPHGRESSTSIETVQDELPTGFHHLYTSIEYECISPLYQYTGSARRTCLKTGKWSGQHFSCLPVCGKLSSKPQNLAQTHWPWHAAIYHRLPDHTSPITGRTNRQRDMFSKDDDDYWQEKGMEDKWHLVCSGALVSQHAVLVPAHCVTEPGQSLPNNMADLKVVLGKNKRLQHMKVSEILIHPSYGSIGFDSDLAILKLVEKARISEFVSPVCLPRLQGGELTANQAYITGWSAARKHEIHSQVAQTGMIELTDVLQCERQFAKQGLHNSITDNMLCGRQHPISSSRVCPARSGGIILVPTAPQHRRAEESVSESSWELLGLVSFGYNLQNCNPHLYTAYTRVANFKNWIENNIK
ncbi:inactive serine protease PAMR1 isoform X1 [Neoarius graeffei]|uniref:inactive serine protease PAMR1 isoform X1 n=2 Tax=Neoarius graeffei TaxID=443677 RepID=UPI00298C1A4A|nr:inactive serine protease PAMR1 isoform X1 [Neoarius graeffei]